MEGLEAKKFNIGKVLIGVGIFLIGVPTFFNLLLFQTDTRDFLYGFGADMTMLVEVLFLLFFPILFIIIGCAFLSKQKGNIGKVFIGIGCGIALICAPLCMKYFYRQPIFFQDVFRLFLPNLFIIAGFVLILKQNLEIKRCFNKVVIIGLTISFLFLFNDFWLFPFLDNLSWRLGNFLFGFDSNGYGFFYIPYNLTIIIQNFYWFIISLLYLLIAVLPTLIIVMGYMPYFKKEETIVSQIDGISNIDKVSYFDGGLWQYIGWKILGGLITILTLGICYPWSLCMIYGWKINHTTIDNKRLKFNGKAISLFGYWILWGFLTIITLGIFGFWLRIALKKWIVKNTSFIETDGTETPLSANTDNGKSSYFDGGLLQFIGWGLLGGLITILTLGFCYPWSLCMKYGWEINHCVIEGKRQQFKGKGISLLGYWLLWSFLTIITLGIFGFWLFIALEKWKVKNSSFIETE